MNTKTLLEQFEEKNPNWNRYVYVVNDDYVKEVDRRKDWEITDYCRTSVYPLPNEYVTTFFLGENIDIMGVAYDTGLINCTYDESFDISWLKMKEFCNANNLKILEKNLPNIDEF